MSDCIFCKIVRGEIPSLKFHDDDLVVSFIDINPINPGHALVMPKKHHVTLFDASPEELQACITVCRKVGRAVFLATGAAGLNLVQNNYRAAGQLIDHVHFHLIPRHEGDGFLTQWPGKPYGPGAMEEMFGRIQQHLV